MAESFHGFDQPGEHIVPSEAPQTQPQAAPQKTVLRLTDKVDDVRFETVKDTLERALAQCDPETAYDREYKPTSCVVILVDETSGRYHVKDYCSAMRTSHQIALLEIAKYRILAERMHPRG